MASNASFRSLLKTTKQSQRLQHPYARYNAAGALSCSVCRVSVKHEQLFASHLSSKGHRLQAAKYEQAEAERKRAREDSAKRPAGIVEYSDDDDEQEEAEPEAKRARTDALPADFFADPSQAPKPRTPTPEPEPETSAPAPAEDDADWLEFEREVIAPTEAAQQHQLPDHEDARYTIQAAPVAYDIAGEAKPAEPEEDEDAPPEETDQERRERLDREEYEEMMSRLEQEEIEQLEADERVHVLRRRLDAVRSAKKTVADAPQAVSTTTTQPKASGGFDLKRARAAKRARGGA